MWVLHYFLYSVKFCYDFQCVPFAFFFFPFFFWEGQKHRKLVLIYIIR